MRGFIGKVKEARKNNFWVVSFIKKIFFSFFKINIKPPTSFEAKTVHEEFFKFLHRTILAKAKQSCASYIERI